MVMKKKIKRKVVRRVKRKVSKPIGIIKDGKTYRFAFGTARNPRKGKKVFNKKSTIMAFARKKGFVK